jgi:PilZ domain-containing protein
MARVGDFNKRAPRIDVRRSAVLIDSDGVEAGVVILDVSSGGFRLKVEELPRIGELVTLRVDKSDEYPAQIRWALGDEAGGVFLAAVNYSEWS